MVLLALLALLVVSAVRGLVAAEMEFVALPQPTRAIVAGLLLIAYLGYGWGLEGRTLGKLVMGLRAVRADLSDMSPWRGLARAALSVLVPPGILWALVSPRAASLADELLDTAVIYDWGFAAASAAPPPPAAGHGGGPVPS